MGFVKWDMYSCGWLVAEGRVDHNTCCSVGVSMTEPSTMKLGMMACTLVDRRAW